MPDTLLKDVNATSINGVTTYRLPVRQLGLMTVAGVVLIVFSLFMGAGNLAVFSPVLGKVIEEIAKGEIPTMVFLGIWLLFPIAFLSLAAFLFTLGLWLIVGTNEIQLSRDRIRAVLRLGFLRLSFQRQLDQIRLFQISVIGPQPSNASLSSSVEFTSLLAVSTTAKPLMLGWGYSKEILRAIADDIAQRAKEALVTSTNPHTIRVEIVENQTAGARRWKPAEKSLIGTGCITLFFLPFLGIGLFIFIMAFVSMKPNMARWDWPILLFPLIFVAIGGGGIYYQWRQYFTPPKSPEKERSVTSESVDHLSNLPNINSKPGNHLDVALKTTSINGYLVISLIGFILCTVLLIPAITSHLIPLLEGKPRFDGYFFPLVLLWLGLTGAILYQFATSNRGVPIVEISAHPLHPGVKCTVYVRLNGPKNWQSLKVTLVCEEEASYGAGTDIRKETCVVYKNVLLNKRDVAISSGQPFVFDTPIQIPADCMHSFKALSNAINWMFIIHGVPERGYFHLKKQYPVIILPRELTQIGER